MYIKDFLSWIKVKEIINKEERFLTVRSGEIRWAAVGVNVGSEMDGKGENFARPVLVLHTIGSLLCLVIPLTSKRKNLPGYIEFDWKDHKDSLCVMQLKTVSTKRILRRIGKIPNNKLLEIKKSVKDFYNF